MNLISDAADIGLGNIHKILDLWRAGKSESLIDYTSPTRVEPIVLVDADCLFHDALPDVMQSLLSTFSGYYLQGVAVSANVGRINVMSHLDKLNPRRNVADSAAEGGVLAAGWLIAQENYQFRLPRMSDTPTMESLREYDLLPFSNVAMEESHEDRQNNRRNDARDAENSQRQQDMLNLNREKFGYQIGKDKDDNARRDAELKQKGKFDQAKLVADSSKTKFGYDKETVTTLKELTNLSVGKVLSVEITDGPHTAMIPVAIRLMASSLPSSALAHILSLGKKDTSASARYHGWRSGRLNFWRDLVYCQDLIDSHRDGLMRDKDGLYRQILGRKRKNTFAGILSGNPSVASASNMVVLSKETADQVELETVTTLNDFATRQRLFEPTSLMIMAVISKEYDRVTFYYRGLAEKTEVSVRDLKASNKGSGPDIAEILKAYTQGHAPSL